MMDRLSEVMIQQGVKVISIRAPSSIPSDADPRSRDHDKWLVSFKVNDWHMDWTRGKARSSLKAALESAFGVPFDRKEMTLSTSLDDLLS